MNLQGDFEGLNLASIFQLLCNDQKTGFLRVTSEDKESRVFFEQGTIVHASASLKEARLGFLMRSDGIISAKQLQKCLALGREKKMSLGKILVDKGYISLNTLKKYNTKQVEEILYNLLFWKKGKFEYKDAKLNLKGMVVTQLNPMKLILEASRRMDEMSVLNEVIYSDKLVFKISGKVESKEEFKLNANEWRVLSLIDGVRTVRQIITESGYDEFAVYKILYSVISYGLIEQNDEAQLEDEPEEQNDYSTILTIYNDILQSIRQNVIDELGNNRATELFDECKNDLDSEYRPIFENYHPDNEADMNTNFVFEAMKGMEHSDEGRHFLIAGFNEYCIHFLFKIGKILGEEPLKQMLYGMEQVLEYVKKYKAGSVEKNKIVSDMHQLILDIENQFSLKKKKKTKGLFSIFK